MKKRKQKRKRDKDHPPRIVCPRCGTLNPRTDVACSACGAPLDATLQEGEPPGLEPDWWSARREPSIVTLCLAYLLAIGSAFLAFALWPSRIDVAVALTIFVASMMAVYQTEKGRGMGRLMPASEEFGRFLVRILRNVGIIFGMFLVLILSPLILLVLLCVKSIS